MGEEKSMVLVFNQLTRESQLYLMNLANMAKIAENSKQKELSNNQPQRTT